MPSDPNPLGPRTGANGAWLAAEHANEGLCPDQLTAENDG
jgi:hypothetical protein